MTKLSQRGKQYLATARTLLRAAQTMTDSAVAAQLKALADDYQRRSEEVSKADEARSIARSEAAASVRQAELADGE
jgi:hypothetical protein